MTTKLTAKQLEALDKAPRIATGQDIETLNPKRRLNRAGRGWVGGPTIVAQQQNPNRKAWSGGYWHYSDKPAQARGQFDVYVVDGEVLLSSPYNGFAYGKNDPETYNWGDEADNPYDVEDHEKRDREFVLIKADMIAKAMQSVLEEQGEPIPGEDEVRRQRLVTRGRHLDNATYSLRSASRLLAQCEEEEDHDLKAEVDDVWEKVLAHRNRLEFEALNLERKQKGEPLLKPSDVLLTGVGDR